MPTRIVDPFASKIDGLDPNINRYVAKLMAADQAGELPVLHGDQLRGIPGHWRQHISQYSRTWKANDSLAYFDDCQDEDVDYSIPKETRSATTLSKHLYVEIGCHKGKVLLQAARDYPEDLFIGIDITFKRVVISAERATKAGLTNLTTVLANARGLDQIFAPGEIDGILLFFPDPWVKKGRQSKNRLIDANFCKMLYQTIKIGGFIWLKTDQQVYFESAAQNCIAAGFREMIDRPKLTRGSYTSSFEERFQAQGLPTWEGVWYRPER